LHALSCPAINPWASSSLRGIVGSLAATYLGQAMGWYAAGAGAGFLASVVGAVVVLAIYGMVTRKSA
jgi:uncharacterized membrane protein YeaQ/YmgE (transglycosylase-associated protein family)